MVSFTLTTISGFKQLVDCAQRAVSYALQVAYFPNCQSDAGAAIYSRCLCSTAYQDVTFVLDGFHKGCATVTVWEPNSVFDNFCSAGLGQPTGTATAPKSTTASITTQNGIASPTASGSLPSARSGATIDISSTTSGMPSNTLSVTPTASSTSAPSSGGTGLIGIFTVGGVVGFGVGIGFLILFGLVFWRCLWPMIQKRRSHHSQEAGHQDQATSYQRHHAPTPTLQHNGMVQADTNGQHRPDHVRENMTYVRSNHESRFSSSDSRTSAPTAPPRFYYSPNISSRSSQVSPPPSAFSYGSSRRSPSETSYFSNASSSRTMLPR